MTTTTTDVPPQIAVPKAQWCCKSCFRAAPKDGPEPPKKVEANQRDWSAHTFWFLCGECSRAYGNRSVTVKLTPEEAFLFERFCREGREIYRERLTPEKILQNFVSDFLGSARNNGSDEREFADRWFQRTHLSWPKAEGRAA